MRKFALAAAVAVLLALPATAAAADPVSPHDLASTACHLQLSQLGAAAFAALYSTNKNNSNGLVQCIAKRGDGAEQQNTANAAKTCKAEQADANFAAAHGGKTFDAFYGTNTRANGKGATANAFGKCVSSAAKQNSDAETAAVVSAAKACRLEQVNTVAFRTAYGATRSAFGKCVSHNSK
jgi:predicted outer membrane protein